MAHLFRLILRAEVRPPRPLICTIVIPYEVYSEGRVSVSVIQYFKGNGNFGGPAIIGSDSGGRPVSFPLDVSRAPAGNSIVLSPDCVNRVRRDFTMIVEWIQFHPDLIVQTKSAVASRLIGQNLVRLAVICTEAKIQVAVSDYQNFCFFGRPLILFRHPEAVSHGSVFPSRLIEHAVDDHGLFCPRYRQRTHMPRDGASLLAPPCGHERVEHG